MKISITIKIFISLLTLCCLFIISWIFYPAKVFNKEDNKPSKLVENFVSFQDPQEITKLLDDKYKIKITNKTKKYLQTIIEIQDYRLNQSSGLLILKFINNKLMTVAFDPKDFEIFVDSFLKEHPLASSDDRFNIDVATQVRILKSQKRIVYSDLRLLDEEVSHLRRYGSD